jgi:hypothetical protein
MGKFEVLNENTWNFASNNDFVWNDTTCFNEENNRQINEKEMVVFLKQLFDILERGVSRSKTEEYGRSKIITYMLDSLFAKTEPEDIPCEIITIINMGIDPSLAHTVYQSIKNKNNENKNSNEKKSIMDKLNILDESTWKFATDDEFIWKGKQIDGSQIKRDAKFLSEKIIVNFFEQVFSGYGDDLNKKITEMGKDKVVTFMLDKLVNNASPGECIQGAITFIKNYNITTINSNIKSYNQENTYIKPEISNSTITDDSKPGIFLFLGIASMVLCCFLFFKTVGSASNIVAMDTNKIVSSIMLPIIIMIIGIIFFGIYSKEKNKRQYYEICKSMEYWLGHKSDELIIAWGTPTKTSKLPQDKSMTLMEYKDSVRNYTGYSTRSYSKGMSFGYHSGQSKSTKYIKTFYVQNGIIVDYKYSIQ